MAAAVDRAVVSSPPRGWLAAWGIHLGLLLLAASALASKQSPPLSLKQSGLLVVVGLALIIWNLLDRRRPCLSAGLRLVMGLGAALLFGLAHAPRATAWVPAGSVRDTLEYLQVSLGTVGILVLFVSWLAYRAAGGERGCPAAPLRRAAVAAGGLIVFLALAVYVALFDIYGRRGDLGTGLVIFQALQFMALLAAVLGSSGGPHLRRAPAYYLGAALLGVAALAVLAAKAGGLG